jgi:hypothetical protein
MKSKFTLLLLPLAFAFATSARAQIAVYVSPNDIQTAEASGIMGVTPSQIFTETFNSRPLGTINGYQSPTTGISYSTSGGADILPNDKYGGYQSGNYLGIAKNNSVTLSFTGSPSQYFGFYFTAGDGNNKITFYSGNTLLFTFSTSTLIGILPKTAGSHVTAINGSVYNTLDYYGQPVSNLDPNEPFAYLHFVAAAGVTFDRIVLSQGTNAIFENDNHSLLAVAPVIPDTLVKVPTTVPEPSALLLSGLGLSAFLLRRKR